MKVPYVVIGGGIAGISCIETISLLDENAPIVLISSSDLIKAVTNVTPLTKMLSEFHVEEKTSDYVSSKYPALHVVVDTAIRIDAERKFVTVSSGRVIEYEKLCLCSGASPKIIHPDSEHIIGIRDTDSAKMLQDKLADAKRVLIVGNGGIATEIVYEIEGVDIVWAVKDRHISAAFVDPGAAEFFQSRLDKTQQKKEVVIKTHKYTEGSDFKGSGRGAALGPNWHNSVILKNVQGSPSKVTIEYEAEVISITADHLIESESWPVFVRLSNGKVYGCDFVVSATGVLPNSESITVENGKFDLANDNGIKVNERMQTNIPNIYAAGDVCSASWNVAKHWFQMRLWTQARQMGCYAARCMVDSLDNRETIQDFCFELFTHVTRFFGYKVILLGLFNAQKLEKNYELMLRVTRGEEYVKLVVSEGKLQGAVLIGDTDLEEMCENLILNQLDISAIGEHLLDPNVDIEDYFD
jgi:small subunit ribosomal protein S18b